MTKYDNLYQIIRQHFSEEELRDLCYNLEIDYEDLPALGKAGKARELVIVCERIGRVSQLISACRQARPHVSWPDTSRPLSLELLVGKSAGPLLPYEPEMVEIPAGLFLLGSVPGSGIPASESPQHPVELPNYAISKYPVTNAQYAEFVKQSRHPKPEKMGWFGHNPPKDKLDHPVAGVSWYDAVAYCRWLSRQTGRPYRLPTEAEWEKAARGTDGRLYPWGNEWNNDCCNSQSRQSSPVTAYPAGASPYGCLDMVGNVSEWTSTLWGSNWQRSDFPYPYCVDDGREDPDANSTVHRIFRGGSFSDPPRLLRCSARAWYAPGNRSERRGFRVVVG